MANLFEAAIFDMNQRGFGGVVIAELDDLISRPVRRVIPIRCSLTLFHLLVAGCGLAKYFRSRFNAGSRRRMSFPWQRLLLNSQL